MTRRLFVTDWAPNGTNDLLIVDRDGEIKACVSEATFGIDVAKTRSGRPWRGWVAAGPQVYKLAAPSKNFLPSVHTTVRPITLAELRKRIACSPLDPNGRTIALELKAAGVDLFGGHER
jgi:hypothetical protein